MLKFVSKMVGLLFLALALIAAVLDITRSIANSVLTYTPLGQDWFNFSNSTLNLFQVGIQRQLGLPWLWDSVIVNILLAPSWLIFAILALMFLWLGRRRDRRIGKRFKA